MPDLQSSRGGYAAAVQEFPIDLLLRWYARHRRDLPFRPAADRPANPYHVLVSEAMAQQTQIATVVPYFKRFVAALPTVADLAAADEQRVLTLWQGLGYYRRARNLHAAARVIVEQFDGRVPDTVEQLLQLPGVGRYTAGAVASVAYGVPAPIVDGNVARVYARYFGIEQAVDQPATLRTLWGHAARLVEAAATPGHMHSRAGDFNQAVMELGALVCTPRSPACLVCPLRETCAALAAGLSERLPIKSPRKQPTPATHTVLAIHKGRPGRRHYLFEQRPAAGLWSKMWQMPTVEVEGSARAEPTAKDPAAEHAARAIEAASAVAQRCGLRLSESERVGSFAHATTHREIEFEVWRSAVEGGRLRRGAGSWRKLGHLADLPLARPQMKVVQMLQDAEAAEVAAS